MSSLGLELLPQDTVTFSWRTAGLVGLGACRQTEIRLAFVVDRVVGVGGVAVNSSRPGSTTEAGHYSRRIGGVEGSCPVQEGRGAVGTGHGRYVGVGEDLDPRIGELLCGLGLPGLSGGRGGAGQQVPMGIMVMRRMTEATNTSTREIPSSLRP